MEHEQSLVVSAQKSPLSTIIVYHAYSEDNIRKLRSLLQSMHDDGFLQSIQMCCMTFYFFNMQ